MTPYYESGGITIFNADCRDLLPHLKADVVVTDPPYGIGHPTDYAARKRGALAPCNDWPEVRGDDEPFNPAPLIGWPAILWGANYYASRLQNSSGWLVWDKMRPHDLDQATCELAWTNCVLGARVFRHLWNGMMRASEHGEAYHPTQKPVALMEWCLTLKGVPGGTVLDPYCGSGPVCIAAKKLGRRAIGIEIEERYCEVAARRLEQGVLFGPPQSPSRTPAIQSVLPTGD